LKAPADPEIRDLVMVLSDVVEQNLHEDKAGWFSDGFCNANTQALQTLVDYGLWKPHKESKMGYSGSVAKWCGWNES